MTRFYIVAKVPVMLQYEKAAVSNSAFKGDVVYYYDVKEEGGESRRGGSSGGEKREMSGEQHPEKREREGEVERLFYYNKRRWVCLAAKWGPVNETLPQLTISPPSLALEKKENPPLWNI